MAKSSQLARLQKRLDAIPKAVKEAVVPTLNKNGDELADMMRRLAPDDTDTDAPDLKSSIEVTPSGQSTPPYSQPGGSQTAGENEVLVTAGNGDVRYPHLQEYGTKRNPAQPFFWPSVRLLHKRLNNRTKRAVKKAVKENWGK